MTENPIVAPLADDDPMRLGPYRLLGVVGAGGMGKVYLGVDAAGRTAAVKALRATDDVDPGMLDRFRREAEVARSVRGPGVAAVLGHGMWGERPWLASEFLPGLTLTRAVDRFGPFAEADVRALGAALAGTLAEIHAAGLVHRDLKPSNVVLTRGGPYIIDFGIARPEHGMTLTGAGSAPATPGFSAPEQALGRRTGPPGDVFALGAVLAFAAIGRLPFGDGHPAAVQFRTVHEEPDLEGVPRALLGVVTDCLAKEPAQRPEPREVARRLRTEWGNKHGTGRGGEPGTAHRTRWLAAHRPRLAARLAPPPRPRRPAWRSGPLAAELARCAAAVDDTVRSAAPEAVPSRRRVTAAASAAAVTVCAVGGGAGWWLLRGDGSGPGVPAATPLARYTTGTAPAPLWTRDGLATNGVGPLAAGEVVVAGTPKGLTAWAVDTGQRAWTWTDRGTPLPAAGLLAAGGVMLAVTAGGRLTAVDPRDGRERWSRALGATRLLAADADTAYVLDGERRLSALPLTGARARWTRSAATGTAKGAMAAVARGRLVVAGADGTVTAYRTDDHGSVAWHQDTTAEVALAPAMAGHTVYLGGASLRALTLADGTQRWSKPAAEGGIWGSPTPAQGSLYVAWQDQLIAVDARSGEQTWSLLPGTHALPTTAPVVQGRSLYHPLGADRFGPDDGVVTVDLRKAAAAWSLGGGGDQPWRLTGAANRVFLSHAGTLHAMPVL
ncbi:PQQ-binding-like beta-propeller repeat protein [Streptomyces sp. NBS 14/10]|uniref:serine/threonine-protein kinase n=1 Tax=Streptomyces sp. NBS 14/10 TaxID=1945643 RepID=UPI000B7F17DB|nr:serine/threonine-protein kinase [Streptomyces sp. NBS 14/10]KAK1186461.1 PQQ-binding-like beta-propeller repeat protein [Streptomyces sp. NBS 14/10]